MSVRVSISCHVSLIIQDEKVDYFYSLHSKETFTANCCICFLRSLKYFSCDHTITHISFLVSKHTTQNSIGIWEEAVNNPTQSSSLQLLCTRITKLCHKLS